MERDAVGERAAVVHIAESCVGEYYGEAVDISAVGAYTYEIADNGLPGDLGVGSN